jgi:hypothetical protein
VKEPGFTYDIGIRAEGGIVLKTLTGITDTQTVFSNLQDGNYEAMVRRVKPDGSKGQWFSNLVWDAACPDLVSASMSSITGTEATLNFVKPTGVLTVEYRIDNGPWIVATGASHVLTGLSPDTAYKIDIRPVMSSLIKGKPVLLQFTTAGGTGPRVAKRKVQEICFGSSHSHSQLRFTLNGGLAALGVIYRIRLKGVTLAEAQVQAGSTMHSIINSLFQQAYGVPGSIYVAPDGSSASFEMLTYSKSAAMGLDYSCGDPNADETADYDIIMV